MTITVTNRGTASDGVSRAFLDIVAASDCTAGELVVLAIAYNNAGTNGADPFNTIYDSSGNTWFLMYAGLNDPSSANAGLCLRVYGTYQNNNQLTAGQNATVEFSPNVVAKVATLTEISSDSPNNLAYSTISDQITLTATPSVTGSPTAVGDCIFGASSKEGTSAITDDSDTTNGSWSTGQQSIIGSGTSGMSVITQAKVATGTASMTFDPVSATNTDCITVMLRIYEVSGAAPLYGNVSAAATFSGEAFAPTNNDFYGSMATAGAFAGELTIMDAFSGLMSATASFSGWLLEDMTPNLKRNYPSTSRNYPRLNGRNYPR